MLGNPQLPSEKNVYSLRTWTWPSRKFVDYRWFTHKKWWMFPTIYGHFPKPTVRSSGRPVGRSKRDSFCWPSPWSSPWGVKPGAVNRAESRGRLGRSWEIWTVSWNGGTRGTPKTIYLTQMLQMVLEYIYLYIIGPFLGVNVGKIYIPAAFWASGLMDVNGLFHETNIKSSTKHPAIGVAPLKWCYPQAHVIRYQWFPRDINNCCSLWRGSPMSWKPADETSVHLVGGWLGHPSEKCERQLGWWHSQYLWENSKNGNQTTNQPLWAKPGGVAVICQERMTVSRDSKMKSHWTYHESSNNCHPRKTTDSHRLKSRALGGNEIDCSIFVEIWGVSYVKRGTRGTPSSRLHIRKKKILCFEWSPAWHSIHPFIPSDNLTSLTWQVGKNIKNLQLLGIPAWNATPPCHAVNSCPKRLGSPDSPCLSSVAPGWRRVKGRYPRQPKNSWLMGAYLLNMW